MLPTHMMKLKYFKWIFDGFQIFLNLMKTRDTDAMRDVACFIYPAMNVRKRLIANLI